MYVADSIYFLFLTVLIFGFIHNNIVVTWFGVASIILLPLCYVGRRISSCYTGLCMYMYYSLVPATSVIVIGFNNKVAALILKILVLL